MPNTSLRTPSYRRHKATGQAVVTLGGRDFYLGKYRSAASREAYQRLVAEWLLAGGKLPAQADGLTVTEVLAAYMRFARTYYRKYGKQTSEIATLKRVLPIVKALYGRSLATEFGPLALKACREQMIRAGWCRNQINKHTDRIKRVFKWAVSEEVVPGTVYESLRNRRLLPSQIATS